MHTRFVYERELLVSLPTRDLLSLSSDPLVVARIVMLGCFSTASCHRLSFKGGGRWGDWARKGLLFLILVRSASSCCCGAGPAYETVSGAHPASFRQLHGKFCRCPSCGGSEVTLSIDAPQPRASGEFRSILVSWHPCSFPETLARAWAVTRQIQQHLTEQVSGQFPQ